MAWTRVLLLYWYWRERATKWWVQSEAVDPWQECMAELTLGAVLSKVGSADCVAVVGASSVGATSLGDEGKHRHGHRRGREFWQLQRMRREPWEATARVSLRLSSFALARPSHQEAVGEPLVARSGW
jgi:hypothetical protein